MKKVFKNLVAAGIVTGLSISSSLIVFGGDNTGWLQLGNAWYYMDEHGVMVTGDKRIAGKDYYFNADGSMEVEEEEWKEAYRQYLIENKSKYSSDNSFGLIDMDRDGIDELFICFNSCWISESLTYQNGQVKQIEWEDAGNKETVGWSRFYEDGSICIIDDHQTHGFKHFYKYEDGKFKSIVYMNYDYDENDKMFYAVNGQRCPEKQYNDKLDELENKREIDWQDFMYSYTSSNINSILGD